jgi:orotate phosphoribosyltransferase
MDNKNFREQLAEFILDPANGVLLDARKRRQPDGTVGDVPNGVFRIPGKDSFWQQYISIAGLFRQTEVFDKCADFLANQGKRLLVKSTTGPAFTALACCSATAHHLMRHIHARLRKPFAEVSKHKPDLRAEYHGMYPLQPDRKLPDYHQERVMLVADVVASGSLCRDLALEIEQKGGTVVGLLAVATVVNSEDPGPRQSLILASGRPIPIYPICGVPLNRTSTASPEDVELLGPDTILRRLIDDPKNGMLLDACDHDRRNHGNQPLAKNPAFELTSGTYQRRFVTSWGLFEKPWYFEYCMEHYARLALEVRGRRNQWFSCIVTCTATGRYIMEHLQSRIEIAGEPVKVHYLGPFPYHNLRHRSLDLKDESVLVVTDVVVKGRMVENMLDVVQRLLGIPVAVIALVGVVSGQRDNPPTAIQYKRAGKDGQQDILSVPAYYLTSYGIPPITGTPDRIYPVDPSTVLPIEAPQQSGFHPLVNGHEALRHFEEAEALTVGFFGLGSRLITGPIHVLRLLEKRGDEVWRHISHNFRRDTILVSTFSKDDAVFHAFIEQRAASTWKSLESVFIPRTESIDFDFPYFASGPVRNRLRGAKVVLVLASTQTSETLRKLVALLAQSEVKQLGVICLLNRMGTRTVSFVSRIRKMLQMRNDERSFDFNFSYVYEICDLNGTLLQRTLESVNWLADQYTAATTEITYQTLVEQEILRHFRPAPLTGSAFEARRPLPGSGSIELDNQEWNYQTLDGKVYAMCHYVTKKREAGAIRDYLPLIKEIGREHQRPILYLIYAILFSDISYLRLSNTFVKVRQTLMDCVTRSRVNREAMEVADLRSGIDANETRHRIEQIMEIERYHLVGLALFSFMDDDREPYRKFLQEYMTSQRDVSWEAWKDYPLNLEFFGGEEKILWAISLIAHFTSGNGFKDVLIDIAQRFRHMAKLHGRTAESSGVLVSEAALTKMVYALDGFLTHLGSHEALQKHQVIRYLQGILIEPRPNHLLIINEPKRAIHRLEDLFEDADTPPMRPVSFDQNEIKRTLDDAIHAAGSLEGIGDALARLFSFHSIAGADAPRYLAGLKSRSGGFRKDVHDVRRMLETIRAKHEISKKQLRDLKTRVEEFESELTLSDSSVLQALQWYIVPFQQKLRSAMEQADIYFRNRKLPLYWKAESNKLEGADHVLCDPNLLKDILWNICTNIRHGNYDSELGDAVRWSMRNDIEIPAPEPEHGTIEVIQLSVESPFLGMTASHDLPRTLPRQQKEIAQFGGELITRHNGEAGLYIATLTLIRRNKTREAWCRRFGTFVNKEI